MYRITYEQGNGYHCSCCRHTSTQEVDLDTKEEVQEWINEFQADLKAPKHEDDDDKYLVDIEIVAPDSLLHQFPPQEDEVSKIIAKRGGTKAEQLAKKKLADKADREKRERKKYEELKNKFENK